MGYYFRTRIPLATNNQKIRFSGAIKRSWWAPQHASPFTGWPTLSPLNIPSNTIVIFPGLQSFFPETLNLSCGLVLLSRDSHNNKFTCFLFEAFVMSPDLKHFSHKTFVLRGYLLVFFEILVLFISSTSLTAHSRTETPDASSSEILIISPALLTRLPYPDSWCLLFEILFLALPCRYFPSSWDECYSLGLRHFEYPDLRFKAHQRLPEQVSCSAVEGRGGCSPRVTIGHMKCFVSECWL